jgi:hypothetical protein
LCCGRRRPHREIGKLEAALTPGCDAY